MWHEHRALTRTVLQGWVRPGETDDLLQDVALAAWKGIAGLREAASFRGWLTQIARNLGRREARRVAWCSGDVAVDAMEPPGQTSDPELTGQADEALASIRALPDCYGQPLRLRLILGLSGSEIAERTGMTPGSVRVNLHRGMAMLRQRLRGDAHHPDLLRASR